VGPAVELEVYIRLAVAEEPVAVGLVGSAVGSSVAEALDSLFGSFVAVTPEPVADIRLGCCSADIHPAVCSRLVSLLLSDPEHTTQILQRIC